MKAYSGEFVLTLTIVLFTNWTNVANGAVAGQEETGQGMTEREVRETSPKPDITKLLPAVIQEITAATGKPFLMFGAPLEDVNKIMRSLQTSHTDYCTEDMFVNGTEFNCKLFEDNKLTLRTVTKQPQHVYLSVHQGNKPSDNTIPTTKCPTLTCPTTTTRPLLTCKEYVNRCRTDSNNDWCQRCKMNYCNDKAVGAFVTTNGETTTNNDGSPCGIAEDQDSQPGGDTLPVVIASVVSFFAGVVVCLLALCLIRFLRERLCLKPIHATYVAKSEKPHSQAMTSKSQLNTTNTTNIAEHEYLDLQCDTMPNPSKKPTHSSENTSTIEQRPPNTAAQTPEYETMSDTHKDDIYNGLGNTKSNPSTVYEHSSPNRSIEHVYSGILDDAQHSDPTNRPQQPLPINKSSGISNANVTRDNQIHATANSQVVSNDYFILEKD